MFMAMGEQSQSGDIKGPREEVLLPEDNNDGAGKREEAITLVRVTASYRVEHDDIVFLLLFCGGLQMLNNYKPVAV